MQTDPAPPGEKWEVEWDVDTTVIYRKTETPEGWVYNCEVLRSNSASTTSWSGEKELSREEVEALPRFVDFVRRRRSL